LPEIGQLGVKARALYDLKFLYQTKQTTTELLSITIGMKHYCTELPLWLLGGVFQSLLLNSLSIPIRKIGDTLVVTEEFGEDSDAANAELNRFLDINVNTFIDAQIINGLGTGETLTGFTS
jgi:hypothetical protein